MLDFQFPVLDETEIQKLLSLFQTDHQVASQSGSEDTNPAVCSTDERKRKRMISNRESARRSRWRKKKHLENLSNEVNRLLVQNREYKHRLGSVTHQCHLVGRDNERLTYEYLALRTKLYDLYRILVTMQLQ